MKDRRINRQSGRAKFQPVRDEVTMNFEVIAPEKEHFSEIRKIAEKSLAGFCPEIITRDDIRMHLENTCNDSILADYLRDKDSSLNLMLDDDRAVGFCHLKLREDNRQLGLITMLHVLPEYEDHKSVFFLYQRTIKPRIDEGMTEVEINIPEGSRKWIDIYTQIGLEFETWRKFDDRIGTKSLTFWPGLLVIVPGC
jgi:hypothetical protein